VEALKALPDLDALLTEKVDEIVAPLDKASSRMITILDEQAGWAEQSAGSVSLVVGKLGAMSNSIEAMSDAGSASLAKLEAPVNKLVEKLQVVETALTTIGVQVEAMQQFSGSLDQFPAQLDKAVDRIKFMGEELGVSTREMSGTLNTFNEDLEGMRSSQVKAASSDATELQKIVENRRVLIESLSGTNDQIESNIVELRTQLTEMSEALIGAAKFIREETGSIT